MSKTNIQNEDNVIGNPKYASNDSSGLDLGTIENGTIGTGSKNTMQKKTNIKNNTSLKSEKVAIYSNKNIFWNGTGKLIRGYNIVSKEASEKWLTRKDVRLATPEEVKREYGL